VKNIEQYQDHITTGFLGTPHINHVLTRFGYLDKAYALLEQKTYPSWLYPVTKGATTIWERWDGIRPDGELQSPSMNSFNHYAYGAIGDWMYRAVAGIDIDESNPGYKKIIIAPKPGGSLTFAKAFHDSMYGKVESGWTVDSSDFQLQVSIPPNTTARVVLPRTEIAAVTESGKPLEKGGGIHSIAQNGANVELEAGSGNYTFVYDSKHFDRYTSRLNLQKSIEEIMSHDLGYQVLIKYIPDLEDHPKLEDFKHMTIQEARNQFIIFITFEELKMLEAELSEIK
jgi:alpha-L-rhamnosidase